MVFISLYIGISETTTYVKSYYDETEWMQFFVEVEFLKYYNDISKVWESIKKELGSKSICIYIFMVKVHQKQVLITYVY